MNARSTFSLAAFVAVLLCGTSLATAAAPNVGQDRSPMQGSVGVIRISALTGTTVLDSKGQKLGRIKDVLLDSQTGKVTVVVLDAEVPGAVHPMTYTAARPIDNPGTQPSLPPPCVHSPDSGWTPDLEGFYNE